MELATFERELLEVLIIEIFSNFLDEISRCVLRAALFLTAEYVIQIVFFLFKRSINLPQEAGILSLV